MRNTKPLLVSRYEEVTDGILREVASRRGLRVCPKVRLADVFDMDTGEMSERERS